MPERAARPTEWLLRFRFEVQEFRKLTAAVPSARPSGIARRKAALDAGCYLIACGLIGEPVAPVITSGGPQKKNS